MRADGTFTAVNTPRLQTMFLSELRLHTAGAVLQTRTLSAPLAAVFSSRKMLVYCMVGSLASLILCLFVK